MQVCAERCKTATVGWFAVTDLLGAQRDIPDAVDGSRSRHLGAKV